jgi:hypothetical protein
VISPVSGLEIKVLLPPVCPKFCGVELEVKAKHSLSAFVPLSSWSILMLGTELPKIYSPSSVLSSLL